MGTLDDFRRLHDPMYGNVPPVRDYGRDLRKSCKTFIVTAAQNATPVHDDWWQILLTIAEKRNAELLVIPLRYKNPTSIWSGSQQDAEHWDPVTVPYLWNRRQQLNANLAVLGDIKTQPTASSPLTGLDAISHASSGIIGHARVQLTTVPTPQSRMAKLLTTTGACTVQNYTDTRMGRIGEFHHSLSAVLLELDSKRFYLRQLHYDAKSRSCTDGVRGERYHAGRMIKAPRPLVLGMGDTHVDSICPQVERATFGKDGLISETNPQTLVWADLLDAYSCNPHHEGNPFISAAKRDTGRDDVRAEVNRAIEYVRARTPKDAQSIIQACNHNDFLHRWIKATDWRRDPLNSEFYLETALAMRRSVHLDRAGTRYTDPFRYWFEQAKVPNARVLDRDESLVVGGIEWSMHGDIGPNGARGSIKNLRRIGVKSVIFHKHAPGIDEGCYQAGTSTLLRLEYNAGASGWLNAHVLEQADSKRQIVVIVDGEYRSRS